jgi:hypothetical protein
MTEERKSLDGCSLGALKPNVEDLREMLISAISIKPSFPKEILILCLSEKHLVINVDVFMDNPRPQNLEYWSKKMNEIFNLCWVQILSWRASSKVAVTVTLNVNIKNRLNREAQPAKQQTQTF